MCMCVCVCPQAALFAQLLSQSEEGQRRVALGSNVHIGAHCSVHSAQTVPVFVSMAVSMAEQWRIHSQLCCGCQAPARVCVCVCVCVCQRRS